MSNEQKLRALLAEAHSFVDPAEGDLFDRIHAALAEPVSDDFRRGAEAMREAAVRAMQIFCEQAMSTGNADWANRYLGIGDELSRLTVPEDK